LRRHLLALVPIGIGLVLFPFGERVSSRTVSVLAMEFMLLILFALLTVSWVRRLVRHPFVRISLMALGIVNVFLGLYTFYRLKDAFLAFPFFLMASYSLFRA